MPDYGHPLRFGSFLTPTAATPLRPVQLTLLSEELGYDLATFQDHPYQPSFLDTWTLMSFAAARTERIHLSGNVLNLPLRQPAVLAKSVASLDLLSGGRVAARARRRRLLGRDRGVRAARGSRPARRSTP